MQLHLGVAEGSPAFRRLVLSHLKNFSRGDFLLNGRGANGADRFDDDLVRFETCGFADWTAVTEYLLERT